VRGHGLANLRTAMSAMPAFALLTPGRALFGCGTIGQVGKEAAGLGSRALLVVGGRSVREAGKLDLVLASLREAGVEPTVFNGVEPEPSIETVDKGREALHTASCYVVVAVGGGSVLDVGKAIGALAHEPEPTEVYHAGREIRAPGIPVIAAPTTSGTGAEVTPNSVLTNPGTNVKASIRGGDLMPTVAIVDPEMTLSMPPEITAYSGLDALTQAIESYTSTGANAVSDLLAREAVRRIAGSLRRAYADGSDLSAREDMALGSLLAGISLASARLGLVHGLAHPVGAAYHIPHGLACAILLPHVMRFNLDAAAPKYALLAADIGLDAADQAACARALLEWVEGLCRDLGAARPLAEFGAAEDDIPGTLPAALASGSTKHNPRPVKPEDAAAVLGAAIAGPR